MEYKCYCHYILRRDERKSLVIHLMGCPESYDMKEYLALPWYKKMFRRNPYYAFYSYHLRP